MPENVVRDFQKRLKYQAQVNISFARGPDRPAMLRIRGATTRRSDRKSFLVTLFDAQRFSEIKLGKFLLLNMLFDPSAFEMYVSYRLLAELGLFPSYFQYASVFINGIPQGLYLLVERPEDAIRRNSSTVVSVIRPNGRNPLLYGCEMDLDFVISRDLQLYSRYKHVLRNLLEELLTEEKLIAELQNVEETVLGIDSGVPQETQIAAGNDRTRRMLDFQQRLLSRRTTLLAGLDPP